MTSKNLKLLLKSICQLCLKLASLQVQDILAIRHQVSSYEIFNTVLMNYGIVQAVDREILSVLHFPVSKAGSSDTSPSHLHHIKTFLSKSEVCKYSHSPLFSKCLIVPLNQVCLHFHITAKSCFVA